MKCAGSFLEHIAIMVEMIVLEESRKNEHKTVVLNIFKSHMKLG